MSIFFTFLVHKFTFTQTCKHIAPNIPGKNNNFGMLDTLINVFLQHYLPTFGRSFYLDNISACLFVCLLGILLVGSS